LVAQNKVTGDVDGGAGNTVEGSAGRVLVDAAVIRLAILVSIGGAEVTATAVVAGVPINIIWELVGATVGSAAVLVVCVRLEDKLDADDPPTATVEETPLQTVPPALFSQHALAIPPPASGINTAQVQLDTVQYGSRQKTFVQSHLPLQ
jgi:hypothetical protein